MQKYISCFLSCGKYKCKAIAHVLLQENSNYDSESFLKSLVFPSVHAVEY